VRHQRPPATLPASPSTPPIRGYFLGYSTLVTTVPWPQQCLGHSAFATVGKQIKVCLLLSKPRMEQNWNFILPFFVTGRMDLQVEPFFSSVSPCFMWHSLPALSSPHSLYILLCDSLSRKQTMARERSFLFLVERSFLFLVHSCDKGVNILLNNHISSFHYQLSFGSLSLSFTTIPYQIPWNI